MWSIFLTLILSFSSVAQDKELKSSSHWRQQTQQLLDVHDKKISKALEQLNLVSKVQSVALLHGLKDQAHEPMIIIAKNTVTGESWVTEDAQTDWLETSYRQALNGTGALLLSVGTKNKLPHYFLVSDTHVSLAQTAASSLKCADALEYHLRFIQHQNRALQNEFQKLFQKNNPISIEELNILISRLTAPVDKGESLCW